MYRIVEREQLEFSVQPPSKVLLQRPNWAYLEHGVDKDGLPVEYVHILVRHLTVHQQRQTRLAHSLQNGHVKDEGT